MNTNIIPQIDVLTILFQGRLVKAAVKTALPGDDGRQAARRGGGKRGIITGFSRASRKRLLENFAKINNKKRVSIFITLTYGQKFPGTIKAKAHLKALLERFRRAYPGMAACWRIEYQERGAPHFHLICFNLPFLPKDDLANIWYEIIGNEYADHSKSPVVRAPFTRIEAIRSPRRLMYYVSKYVAKVVPPSCAASPPSLDEAALPFDGGAVGEVVGGFITGTYQHVGRWWGFHNLECFPYAEPITLIFREVDKRFFQFRRAAKRFYSPLRVGVARQGFTLFVSNAAKWHDYLQHCIFAFDGLQGGFEGS